MQPRSLLLEAAFRAQHGTVVLDRTLRVIDGGLVRGAALDALLGSGDDASDHPLACDHTAELEAAFRGQSVRFTYGVASPRKTRRQVFEVDLLPVMLGGLAEAIVVTARDVTQHVADLERGQRSEGLARAVLDSSIAAVLHLRMARDERGWPIDLLIVDLTEPALAIVGGAHASWVGRSLSETSLGRDPSMWRLLLDVAASCEPRDIDARIQRDGSGPMHVHGRAVWFDGGVVVTLVDLTERDAFHERAALDDRLASLGRLAAGVAHELNNPLTWIQANLALARANVAISDGHASLLAMLDDAIDGSARLGRIVRDLRPANEGTQLDSDGIDVEHAVSTAAKMSAHSLQGVGSLELAIAPSLPRAVGNASRLTQVLLNLMLNAGDALRASAAGGGTVRVSASLEGDFVRIDVSDDGCGMDAAVLARLCEPFFTTRAGKGGTGLGLWVARTLVDGFGGSLQVESRVGRGTTVSVRLPLLVTTSTRASRSAPRIAVQAAPALGGGAPQLSILIVDDELIIGRAVKRCLSAHRVVVETSGEAALARLRAGERYDLLLTDLTMPGLDGLELIRTAPTLDPGLEGRIVVMTGGTSDAILAAVVEHAREVLDKPFDIADLRALVTRYLPRAHSGDGR